MLDKILFVFVVTALGWHFWERSLDKAHPWPDYAAPMACAAVPGTKFEGEGLRFQHPPGWHVSVNTAPGWTVSQTYLAPRAGDTDEVTLFMRERGSGGMDIAAGTVVEAKGGVRALPQAPPDKQKGPPTSAATQIVPNTQTTIALDANRSAVTYLTRTWDPERGPYDTWMIFMWDPSGKLLAINGPRLFQTKWPPDRKKNEDLNCAFWSTVRTVEPN